LDDPKVQRLEPVLFKAWVNILCIASRNDGALPALEDLAFSLRVSVKEAGSTVDRLCEAGLLDRGDPIKPHNWDERQFRSDTSTDRVKRFRQRSAKHHGNGTTAVPGNTEETPSGTAPEQSRAETEQSRADAAALRSSVRSKVETLVNSPSITQFNRIDAWLEAGAIPERDIYPSIEAGLKKLGKPPNSLKYFDGFVSDAIAARTAPMPAGNPRATSPKVEIDPTEREENLWFARLTAVAAGARWDPQWGRVDLIPAHIRAKYPDLIARLSKPKEAA
jgi:hypothetical protein